MRWKALRGGPGDLRVREVACVGAARTLLCVELGDSALPTVTLSAGIHGDEPAGPWALLELVESDALDPRCAYRVWPCTNPTGFDARTRASVDSVDLNRTFGRGGSSPEAKAVVMSNRDRKFELAMDLHEDDDADGFYCYEYGVGDLATAAVAAVRAGDFPIQPLGSGFDLGWAPEPGTIVFAPGIARPDPHAEGEALGGLSYALLLARGAAGRVLTFETPSRLPWESRVAMHRTAVAGAVADLLAKR